MHQLDQEFLIEYSIKKYAESLKKDIWKEPSALIYEEAKRLSKKYKRKNIKSTCRRAPNRVTTNSLRYANSFRYESQIQIPLPDRVTFSNYSQECIDEFTDFIIVIIKKYDIENSLYIKKEIIKSINSMISTYKVKNLYILQTLFPFLDEIIKQVEKEIDKSDMEDSGIQDAEYYMLSIKKYMKELKDIKERV